jgi:hypothetical protein
MSTGLQQIRTRALAEGTRGAALPVSLALASIGSLFVRTESYPLVVAVGQAQLRIQDVLFGLFVVSLVFGPRDLRSAIARAARSPVPLLGLLFFALALQSLGRVPSSHLGESAIAVGKLLEFAIVGALAGITIVVSGAFAQLVAVLAVGSAVNAVVSLERDVSAGGLDGLLSLRRDGLLGQDILAVGGAVTALGGLALMSSRGRERYVAIAAITSGLLALLAGKSVLAAGAFFAGALLLSVLVQRPAPSVAFAVSIVVLAGVVAARYSDVAALADVFDPPRVQLAAGEPIALNLLSNGGCEFDTDGWNATRQASLAWVSTPQRFGRGACKVSVRGATASEGVFHNITPVVPGVAYSLSGWVKAPAGKKLALRLEWLDDRQRFISGPYEVLHGTAAWRRTVLENVRAPQGARGARPTLYTAGSAQPLSFYVDGVQLEQGDTATPYGTHGIEPTVNLVSNSGFEAGGGQWHPNGNGTRATVTGQSRFGSSALRIAASGAGQGVFHERIRVQEGAPYSLSAWVRGSPERARLSLTLEWLGNYGQLISSRSKKFVATGKWQRVTLRDVRAPGTAVSGRPSVYRLASGRRFAFDLDAVQLEQRRAASPYHGGGVGGALPPGASVVYAGGSAAHRLLLAYIGARIALDHLWRGVGWLESGRKNHIASPRYERAAAKLLPGVDPKVFPSHLLTHSHNAYLETAGDAGVPAALAFLAAFFSGLWLAIRSSRRLGGSDRIYAAAAGAMLLAVAFWLNSNPLFGGSLEMGLFWCAIGMSITFASLSSASAQREVRAADER